MIGSLFTSFTTEDVRLLLAAGADVSARDKFNSTPLHYQSIEGAMRLLILAGADVHSRDIFNRTPLHHQKDEGAVRLLLDAGADVNARSNSNNTSLHFQRDEGAVRLLILAGADVNARNDVDSTPLYYQRDEVVIRLLISAGADVNKTVLEFNPIVGRVYNGIKSDIIRCFITEFKVYKSSKTCKTSGFMEWYCGEGGVGRLVDHNRIYGFCSTLH
jgi:hypothetical protein